MENWISLKTQLMIYHNSKLPRYKSWVCFVHLKLPKLYFSASFNYFLIQKHYLLHFDKSI